jgi:hypothetical protein
MKKRKRTEPCSRAHGANRFPSSIPSSLYVSRRWTTTMLCRMRFNVE